jgi:hypothetical protein
MQSIRTKMVKRGSSRCMDRSVTVSGWRRIRGRRRRRYVSVVVVAPPLPLRQRDVTVTGTGRRRCRRRCPARDDRGQRVDHHGRLQAALVPRQHSPRRRSTVLLVLFTTGAGCGREPRRRPSSSSSLRVRHPGRAAQRMYDYLCFPPLVWTTSATVCGYI